MGGLTSHAGALAQEVAAPVRVLLVVGGMHPREGGPPRVVAGSACALARSTIAVEIATMGETEDRAAIDRAWPELAQLGVSIAIFPRRGPKMFGYSPALSRFVATRAERIDIVHVHGVWEVALAAATRIARSRGIATLVSPHGMLDRWQLTRSRLKKRIALALFGTGAMLRHSDAILYGTREEADEAADIGLSSPIEIMPNGVDRTPLPDGRASLHTRFPQMRRWTRTIVFFSRMHPKKGLDLLVEAFGAIRERFPGAGLLAVAIPQDADYEAAVRARAAAIGSDAVVIVTDLIGPEARGVLSASDIFALPSHQEGFSIAILEAAGAGLPLLITDKCHMPEITDLGVGTVVADTAAGLERGLVDLLSLDSEALAEMGRRAAEMVERHYTWDSIAARLGTLYRRVARRT